MWRTYHVALPGESLVDTSAFKMRSEDSADRWTSVDGHPILGVADGLGSYLRAADASVLALQVARTHTQSHTFPSDLHPREALRRLTECVTEARSDFLRQIDRFDDRDEWKTTLALVMIIERQYVLYVAMGDAFVAMDHELIHLTRDPATLHIAQPPRLDLSSLKTHTLHDSLDRMITRAIVVPSPCAVLLSTDGFEYLISCESLDHELRLDPMMRTAMSYLSHDRIQELDAMLSNPDLRHRKGDDIGVAMAAWHDN